PSLRPIFDSVVPGCRRTCTIPSVLSMGLLRSFLASGVFGAIERSLGLHSAGSLATGDNHRQYKHILSGTGVSPVLASARDKILVPPDHSREVQSCSARTMA